jgi:hypothetical protein
MLGSMNIKKQRKGVGPAEMCIRHKRDKYAGDNINFLSNLLSVRGRLRGRLILVPDFPNFDTRQR